MSKLKLRFEEEFGHFYSFITTMSLLGSANISCLPRTFEERNYMLQFQNLLVTILYYRSGTLDGNFREWQATLHEMLNNCQDGYMNKLKCYSVDCDFAEDLCGVTDSPHIKMYVNGERVRLSRFNTTAKIIAYDDAITLRSRYPYTRLVIWLMFSWMRSRTQGSFP